MPKGLAKSMKTDRIEILLSMAEKISLSPRESQWYGRAAFAPKAKLRWVKNF